MAAFIVLNGIATDRAIRRERVFRDRLRILDTMDEKDLFANYRMGRKSLLKLVELTTPYLSRETKRSQALSPEIQVLSTIRYLSKGGFYSEIGEIHNISRASVSRVIKSTVGAICDALDNIKFPQTPSEHRSVKEGFHNIAGFPHVLGCIDGTLIPITTPSGPSEVAYVCRKNFHAVNVQAVCDSSLRFLNVVSRWPGATHDSVILLNSDLGQFLENNPQNGWLLGDSGYACRPWLLTPFADPQSRAEEKFNSSHCRTRNTIERAFGVLKSRFRCLHKSTGCLPFSPDKCTRVIMCCFKLHNFCLSNNVPQVDVVVDDDADDDNAAPVPAARHCNDGQGVRNQIVRERFS